MLKYHVVPIKNPIDQSVKYYARLAPVMPVSLHELCENISRQCTVTTHDVKAVLSALEEQIYISLRNGNSVRLGDLGSFHPTLGSTGVGVPTDFTSAFIRNVKVRFVASPYMRYQLSKLHPSVNFLNLSAPPTPPESGGDVIA